MIMSRLKALIVEDELNSRISLKNMLENYCANVEVVGLAENIDEAVKKINLLSPDLVFLDIELPEKNGFQLFEYFPKKSFDVVFTTAYNEFAVKAFKMSAIDYLLKPIDLELLRSAISKVVEKKDIKVEQEQFKLLRQNMNNVLKKLALPVGSGMVFVELSEIIRCQASGNYTDFYLTSGEKIMISKSLKIYDDLLSGFNFCRISRSDLVNINHVKRFNRQKRSSLITTDDEELIISDARKEHFFSMINQF